MRRAFRGLMVGGFKLGHDVGKYHNRNLSLVPFYISVDAGSHRLISQSRNGRVRSCLSIGCVTEFSAGLHRANFGAVRVTICARRLLTLLHYHHHLH